MVSSTLRAAAALGAAAVMSAPGLTRAAEVAAFTLRNPSAFSRQGELIRIENLSFHRAPGVPAWAVEGKCHRPAQWVASSDGGVRASLVFAVDLGPDELKRVRIVDAKPRTRQCSGFHPARATLVERNANGAREIVARTVVPAQHQPGSGIYGFEGIGWESGKVGYRLYLDYRNAIDVFGKRKPEPVLTQLALSGAGYHAMTDWGMDILKVGESLGIGAIGAFADGRIVRFEHYDRHEARVADEGPVLAAAEVSFTGWRVGAVTTDIRSRYEISAGSALTRADVEVSGPHIPLATGVARNPAAKKLTPTKAREWQYVASCGEQSLVPDELGLAVLFRAADRLDEIQDGHTDAVVLRPSASGGLTYYFLASWAQESGANGSCRPFHERIEQIAEQLSDPVVVSRFGY